LRCQGVLGTFPDGILGLLDEIASWVSWFDGRDRHGDAGRRTQFDGRLEDANIASAACSLVNFTNSQAQRSVHNVRRERWHGRCQGALGLCGFVVALFKECRAYRPPAIPSAATRPPRITTGNRTSRSASGRVSRNSVWRSTGAPRSASRSSAKPELKLLTKPDGRSKGILSPVSAVARVTVLSQ